MTINELIKLYKENGLSSLSHKEQKRLISYLGLKDDLDDGCPEYHEFIIDDKVNAIDN